MNNTERHVERLRIDAAVAERMKTLPPSRAKPFLKWVGGKRQLLPELFARVPASFNNYFEPFVGAGALLYAIGDRCTGYRYCNDANTRLIRTYRGVRDNVENVIGLLQSYAATHCERVYYEHRDKDVDIYGDAGVAAWMIYMNKTCFNGLYRVNKSGKFNSPFGRYTNPTICDAEALRACSAALEGVNFDNKDFRALAIAERTRRGDFVYFDPPYAPLTQTSSFTGYTRDGFGPEEQTALRDLMLVLKHRGVNVLQSNSSAPIIRDLYSDKAFKIEEVSAKRSINSVADKRGEIKELLIS